MRQLFRRGGANKHESLLDIFCHRCRSLNDAIVADVDGCINVNGFRRNVTGERDAEESPARGKTSCNDDDDRGELLLSSVVVKVRMDVNDCGLSLTIETFAGSTP